MSVVYDGLPEKILDIYDSCSEAEKQYLMQILEELSTYGYSQTYEEIWLADFKEVPVSIDEFICNPIYLGETNRNGEAVYPFWRETVREIFNSGNQYNEIILSGATRIGKTSTATIINSYMLYRLMLYKDPHAYFQKKQVSKFTIAFANLTKELAEGVAFREFNDTLKNSQWFNEHGRFSRSDRKFYYIPDGDKIDVLAASDAAHLLGMQIWACLIGDTRILTADGIKTLEECSDTGSVDLYQMNSDGDIIDASAEVVLTKYVTDTIRIELEDGSVIEGTPDHKVMLSDGSYKSLGELTNSDDLLTLNSNEVDEMHLSCYNKLFLVYVHTSPSGKRYIGITSKSTQERWGNGGIGYQSNLHLWSAICKYGWDSFQHEVVASGLTLQEACELESRLIAQYDTMNPDFGYNHTTGGNWSTPDKETRAKLSAASKQRCSDPEYRRLMSERLLGHTVSEVTRLKISRKAKGRKMPMSHILAQRRRRHSSETLAKLRGHTSWIKGLTKETDDRVMAISNALKGRVVSHDTRVKLSNSRKLQYENGYDPVWITNGIIETTVQRSETIPEGFRLGRLNHKNVYVFKGSESKKIPESDLAAYIQDGWSRGRPPCTGAAIRKANQKYYWDYDGERYDSAEELAIYLREHGYPKIVGSTITSLYNKGFIRSKTYHTLAGKIQKVDL